MKFGNFMGLFKKINKLRRLRRNLLRFSFYFILLLIYGDNLTPTRIVKALAAAGIMLIITHIIDRVPAKVYY